MHVLYVSVGCGGLVGNVSGTHGPRFSAASSTLLSGTYDCHREMTPRGKPHAKPSMKVFGKKVQTGF